VRDLFELRNVTQRVQVVRLAQVFLTQIDQAPSVELAREAARVAIERSFAMPLQAAGIGDAQVVARFADEGDNPSYLDRSATYNEAIEEARRRRAAEGR